MNFFSKSMGLQPVPSPGILAGEKLIAIDPPTKALLAKWVDAPFSAPQGNMGQMRRKETQRKGAKGNHDFEERKELKKRYIIFVLHIINKNQKSF